MREPNKNYVYSLDDLTRDEKIELGNNIFKPENVDNVFKFPYIRYDKEFKTWLATECAAPTTNAKELFYTLENIQVDCSELTEDQIKEMCKVYESDGYKQWIDPEAFIIIDNFTYLRIDSENEFYITGGLDTKNTITYDKFMELFGYKEKSQEFKNLVEVLNEELTEEAYKETDRERINLEFNPQSEHKLYEAYKEAEYEVKYIAEKPKQYQAHYNNENGSLYKIATDLGLNHWEFDIFKRLVRCRKKNQFKEDLQKIKDTIDIYLNEFTDEK